jgi:hypothetical protein
MRTPIVVAAAGLLALAAGGGYYGLEVYPRKQARAFLDRAMATLPAGTTGSFQGVHFSVASHELVITGLKLHGTGDAAGAGSYDVTADTVDITDPNMSFSDVWAKAAANPAAIAPAEEVPVAGAVDASHVTFRSSAFSMTQASVKLTKLRLSPWAILHPGVPSFARVRDMMMTAQKQPMTLADLQPMLRFEAAMLLGVGYDTYQAGETKMAVTAPGTPLTYEIHAISGGGFDRGVMGQMGADGITMESPQIGSFAIGHLTMAGGDFRAPVTRIVMGDPLSPALLDGVKVGAIDYTDVTARPPNHPPVHIGAMTLGPIAFAQGVPVSGAFGWKDVHVARADLPQENAREALEKLGLDGITVSFGFSYDWDVAHHTASIHDTELKVNELGSLGLSADLADVTADRAALSQIRLAHAKLRFDNASLVERMLKAGAARSGADPTAFRGQIVQMVNQQGAAAGKNDPAAAKMFQAISDFIATPRSLTVTISPPEPVPVLGLAGAAADPAQLAHVLGLAVTANAP